MGSQCEDLERGLRGTPTQRREEHIAQSLFPPWEPQEEVVRCVTHLLPAWKDSGQYGEEAQILRRGYRLGEFSFQGHIFLPFHTVHGVLKPRILVI